MGRKRENNWRREMEAWSSRKRSSGEEMVKQQGTEKASSTKQQKKAA